MKGKTVLITGATSGIGYETALALAKMQAKVVFTTRDLSKGQAVQEKLRDLSGNKEIFAMQCRLDDFSSITRFAQEFLSQYAVLHVLINNAGVWETQRRESVDGIELTFAVNHLAPFLLTQWLLPLLRSSTPSRIITVSSQAHKGTRLQFDDLEFNNDFPFMKAYSQSKLANIYFTRYLAKVLEGSGVTANCLHPGVVNTAIFNNMNGLLKLPFKAFMISPQKGAETSIFLASSPDVKELSGLYFSKKKVTEVSKEAQQVDTAKRLWGISKTYTTDFLPDYAV